MNISKTKSNSLKNIKVLIVDDSRLIRELLHHILNNTADIEVVGTAADAYEARDKIKLLNPDVITLDVEMPKMNGLEFLEKLMKARPMPVVMFSSLTKEGSETTFKALELGAVDFITKPSITDDSIDIYTHLLADKVRAASRAKVYKKIEKTKFSNYFNKNNQEKDIPKINSTKIIAVGASTGGTEAIKEFLTDMPITCPGILIAQHMPANFTRMFADRLNNHCLIAVKEAEHNELILSGHAYIAPGGKHLSVVRSGKQYYTNITEDPPVNLHRPSVDYLFFSVAKNVGKNAIGIIMTGMGRDGTKGLLEMKKEGAFNIAQDEESSVIFGMPREAINAGAAHEIVALNKIKDKIVDYLEKK
mgnify:CR=1 FL=1